jgi:hypothetical protein
MKGKFVPRNPSKYMGNPTEIIFRSKWELDIMRLLDTNDDVIGWGSEEVVIPYISPVDGKRHRYFTDMIIKKKNGDVVLVEVKPFKQTQQPKVSQKQTKQYIQEVATYVINKAKWKAAEEYCLLRGWKFQILTEKEIYGK